MCNVEKQAYQEYCQALFQRIATAEGRQELLTEASAFLENTASRFKSWGIPETLENCADFLDACFDDGDFPLTIFPLFFEEWKRQNARKKELREMEVHCPAIPTFYKDDECEDLDEDQASIMQLINSYDEPSVSGQHTAENDELPDNNGNLPF